MNQKISKEAGDFIEILTIGLNDCKFNKKLSMNMKYKTEAADVSFIGTQIEFRNTLVFISLVFFTIILKESQSKMGRLYQSKADILREAHVKHGAKRGL